MKTLFAHLLLASLTTLSDLAQSPAPINLAITGTAEELIALERTKVDYIFGTPEQKQAAIVMFGTDFHGIEFNAAGASRGDYARAVKKLSNSFFPPMPPGALKMSDVQVFELQPECSIVSYAMNGPGPDGTPWTGYLSSIWVRRGNEWKTSFYQVTVVPPKSTQP
ncbi:MAG: hypothetical protein QM760_08130 [Nibricoccus sp.]